MKFISLRVGMYVYGIITKTHSKLEFSTKSQERVERRALIIYRARNLYVTRRLFTEYEQCYIFVENLIIEEHL